MKTLIVDTISNEIDFNPSTTEAEIMQNIRTIVSTTKLSVPLDRDFGVNGEIIDSPVIGDSGALRQAAIFEAIAMYEPRVEVQSISFVPSNIDPSVINTRIIVAIKEGVA